MDKTISLKHISKEYNTRFLFKDLSIKLSQRERLFIVGENGTGKTTLLKIILGTLEPDDGVIMKSAAVRCHLVAQEFDVHDRELTIEGFLEKHANPALLKKIFSTARTLGYDLEKNLQKICAELSGGQQKILMLSLGMAMQPDFLLLDEPENHLDIVSRLELIGLLQAYRGGIICISHDRTFIDALADKVGALEDGGFTISEGGYEAYINARLERLAGLTKAYKIETSRIKQLQKSVVILQQKAIRGKGLSQYHRRKEELAGLKESHKSGPPEHKETKINIRQTASNLYEGRLIVRIEKGEFAYSGAATLFKDVSLEMRTGSHVILLGRNGVGKSTFLQSLLGTLPLSKGEVSWMHGVKTAYFDQHATFDPEKSALSIVMEKLKVSEDRALEALGVMRFTSERARTSVSNLSGGERMRLRFALVFGAKPNFILLDEPTNHLDEVTWEILLDAVNTSSSTILLVTHDYEFIEGVQSKRFWVMDKGIIRERHKELAELVEELR